MENSTPTPQPDQNDQQVTAKEEKSEKELDQDDEMHKTIPDLITKESHRLPVDDEVKKG